VIDCTELQITISDRVNTQDQKYITHYIAHHHLLLYFTWHKCQHPYSHTTTFAWNTMTSCYFYEPCGCVIWGGVLLKATRLFWDPSFSLFVQMVIPPMVKLLYFRYSINHVSTGRWIAIETEIKQIAWHYMLKHRTTKQHLTAGLYLTLCFTCCFFL